MFKLCYCGHLRMFTLTYTSLHWVHLLHLCHKYDVSLTCYNLSLEADASLCIFAAPITISTQ